MVSKRGELPIPSHPSGDQAPTRVFSEDADGSVIVDDSLSSIRRLESDPNSIVIFISGLVRNKHEISQAAAGVVFAPSSPSNISQRLPILYPKLEPIAELYALRRALGQFLRLSRHDKNLWYSPQPVAREGTRRGASFISKNLQDETQSEKDDIKSDLEQTEKNPNTEKESGELIDTSETDPEDFPIEPQEKNELETDAKIREALREALHEAVQGLVHRREDAEFQKVVQRILAKIQDMIELLGRNYGVMEILKEIDALREVCDTPPQPAPKTRELCDAPPQPAPKTKRFGISRVVIITECEKLIDTFCESNLNDLLKGPSRKAMRKGAQFAKEVSQKEALKRFIEGQIKGGEVANRQSFKKLMETKADLEKRLSILYELQNYKIYIEEKERVMKVAEKSGRTAACERRLVELNEDICKSIKAVEKLCRLDFWLVGKDTLHEARDLANQAFSSKHDFGAKQSENYEFLDNLRPEERRNIGEN